MNVLYPVYTCEDYDINDGVLIVEKPVLVAMIRTAEQFVDLTKNIKYKAIVCPDLIHRFDYVKFI
jgi:hypothetical protein